MSAHADTKVFVYVSKIFFMFPFFRKSRNVALRNVCLLISDSISNFLNVSLIYLASTKYVISYHVNGNLPDITVMFCITLALQLVNVLIMSFAENCRMGRKISKDL
jgi:hypothetical protein